MTAPEMNNQYVLSLIIEAENEKKRKIVQDIRNVDLVLGNLSDDVLLKISSVCVSNHQTNIQKNGAFLENDILSSFLDVNSVPYRKQVTIDKSGIIVGFNEKKKRCYHILDFVIGENINAGKSITEFIVISCKTTCRERWTQDDWSHTFAPKLYILLTISKDYPSSDRFRESTTRKIITSSPKNKDNRIYKLNFDHLIDELTQTN
jgi:methylmalonyl-CoA mutase N-terminal domain/subunit